MFGDAAKPGRLRRRARTGPTSRDLAKLAGVSQSTVSRVLAKDPSVNPENRAAVEKAARELNYIPNAFARAMRLGRSDAIGVLVTRVTNPLHAELLFAIGKELHAANLDVLLWNLEAGGAEASMKAIRQRQVDGLLVTSAAATGDIEREIMELGIPLVLVHRGVEGLPCDQVLGDNFQGAYRVAEYFARGGLRSASVFASHGIGSASRDRTAGFVAGAKATGMRVDVVQRGSSHNDGVNAARDLLTRKRKPQGIFAASDILALGALDGARSLGLRVPEDVWVAGFDDIEMASWHSLRLTTVREPIEELARMSVELLRSRLAGDAGEPRTVRLDCPLVVRGSTLPMAEDALGGA